MVNKTKLLSYLKGAREAFEAESFRLLGETFGMDRNDPEYKGLDARRESSMAVAEAINDVYVKILKGDFDE